MHLADAEVFSDFALGAVFKEPQVDDARFPLRQTTDQCRQQLPVLDPSEPI